MTDQAAAPAPAGQQLAAVPALNTPAGMAARKATHPALRGQVQPGTQPPLTPPAQDLQTPTAPSAAPVIPPQAPVIPQQAPVIPQQAPAVPDTNLLTPPAPPPLQYTQIDTEPYQDPRLKAMQDRLDAQDAAARKAEAEAARNRLLNPAIDYTTIGDIDADQAQAMQDKLVRPQLNALFEHFDNELKARDAAHAEQLKQFQGVGTTVAEVQHQQTVSQNTKMAQLNADIMASHPTFVSDFNDPAFMQAAGPYHNEIAQAYHAGNSQQVIAALDYVKGQMAAPPTGVEGGLNTSNTASTAPAPEAELQQVKQSDIRNNIEWFKTGQIDRATYLQKAAEYKAAERAGLVVAG